MVFIGEEANTDGNHRVRATGTRLAERLKKKCSHIQVQKRLTRNTSVHVFDYFWVLNVFGVHSSLTPLTIILILKNALAWVIKQFEKLCFCLKNFSFKSFL